MSHYVPDIATLILDARHAFLHEKEGVMQVNGTDLLLVRLRMSGREYCVFGLEKSKQATQDWNLLRKVIALHLDADPLTAKTFQFVGDNGLMFSADGTAMIGLKAAKILDEGNILMYGGAGWQAGSRADANGSVNLYLDAHPAYAKRVIATVVDRDTPRELMMAPWRDADVFAVPTFSEHVQNFFLLFPDSKCTDALGGLVQNTHCFDGGVETLARCANALEDGSHLSVFAGHRVRNDLFSAARFLQEYADVGSDKKLDFFVQHHLHQHPLCRDQHVYDYTERFHLFKPTLQKLAAHAIRLRECLCESHADPKADPQWEEKYNVVDALQNLSAAAKMYVLEELNLDCSLYNRSADQLVCLLTQKDPYIVREAISRQSCIACALLDKSTCEINS